MITGLTISVCGNIVLLAALVVLWRQRQFRKPFNPTVSVYAQGGGRHGWVTAFEVGRFGEVPRTHRPVDAARAPLSEILNFVNMLIRKHYYVTVVRTVPHKHWRETV